MRVLRDYLAFMTERGDERTSIIRRRASLRGYFTWMVQRGHLDESPAARLSAPRPNHRLPKIVVREQLDNLLDDDWGDDAWATLGPRGVRGPLRRGPSRERTVRPECLSVDFRQGLLARDG